VDAGAGSAGRETIVKAVAGVYDVGIGLGVAAVANWRAIAMAASISKGEQSVPVAVLGPVGEQATG
jgi:hypothetical protein